MTLDEPITLTDGQGFIWDIQPDGRIGNCSSDAFDAGSDNTDLIAVSSAQSDMDDRQVHITSTSVSNPNITLERRIYVPADAAWARFIDTATNTTDAEVTYTFRQSSNFGSDTLSQVVESSTGDTSLGTDDTFFINDDAQSTSGDPQVALAFGDGTRFFLATRWHHHAKRREKERRTKERKTPSRCLDCLSASAVSKCVNNLDLPPTF